MEAWDEEEARGRLLAAAGLAGERLPTPRVAYKRHLSRHAGLAGALAASLAACLAIGAWQLSQRGDRGRTSAVTISAVGHVSAPPAPNPPDTALAAQTASIARLRAEVASRNLELDKLQSQLHLLQQRFDQERTASRHDMKELAEAKADSDGQVRVLSLQRDKLSEQLRDARLMSEGEEAELASLHAAQEMALDQLTNRENRLREVSAINQDQEKRLKDVEQMLASDRDIRDLMSARNLYIADVFDVDSTSRTRKPFGRIFYTRGKSLLFYAFDLDRQPKVKEASAFQVWGKKETAQGEAARPLDLGILYLDSESNRRWVLRFDDPQALAEIDAVFVTVEPRGGSRKPSGKPFLFAMLRKEANHP
jgi:hypothetical protein